MPLFSFLKKHQSASALFVWMVVIFGFSSMSGTASLYPSPFWYVVERKGAHIFEFGVLAFLAGWFFRTVLPKKTNKSLLYWLIFLFCTTYALSDEIHQFFVFGRQAKFTDVFIDDIGVLCGILLFSFWHRKKKGSRFFQRLIRIKKAPRQGRALVETR